MPRTQLPVADAAGSLPRADPDRATRAAIDWRQLSHELRTPLNAILGNTELLLDGSTGPLSAQARACLGEVQGAGRQLLRQVQLLLAWSELGAGRPQLATRRVDLIALIRAALTEARAETLRIEPHDAHLLVCGDRFWLQMLVAEIIALNGAPRPAPRVTLDKGTGRSAVRLAWPVFCAVQTGALQMALIEAIARLHGAAVVRHADGVSLHWPPEAPALPPCIAATPAPETADGAGAARARAPAGR
jgi:hypothetical protein